MSAPNTTAIKRIQKELKDLHLNPAPDVLAVADPENILVIYFLLDGAAGTPYENGEYFGRMLLPATYPFAPPSFFVMTPNGRFQTETSICTSFSSYHPATWSPSWNIGSMASGLLSFMSTTDATAGSVTTTDETKRTLAEQSRAFNCKQPRYKALFPERYELSLKNIAEQEEEKKKKKEAAAAAASAVAQLAGASQTTDTSSAAAAAAVAQNESVPTTAGAAKFDLGQIIAIGVMMLGIGFLIISK